MTKIKTPRLRSGQEKIQKSRAPHNPTKAHSTKKGKRGYDRREAKRSLNKA